MKGVNNVDRRSMPNCQLQNYKSCNGPWFSIDYLPFIPSCAGSFNGAGVTQWARKSPHHAVCMCAVN